MGRFPAPTNTRSGVPTAAATIIANITGLVAGNSVALESLETTFQQDLNGDGTIGIPSVTIEAHGSTKLVQVGSNY